MEEFQPWRTFKPKNYTQGKIDPHGWIQFKGTELCLDVHCECGEISHIDSDFVYYVECGYCGIIYELSGFIEFNKIENLLEDRKQVCKKSDVED